jgi:hypothetical protein
MNRWEWNVRIISDVRFDGLLELKKRDPTADIKYACSINEATSNRGPRVLE